MKKSLLVLVIAVQTLALCACSLIKDTPSQSSNQDSVASSNDVINYNVTIGEDGKLQYTDDQGNLLQMDSEWTDNELIAGIPKPDFGEIISISSLDDACFVRLSNVTEQDINNYIDTLITAGFSNYAKQKLDQGQLIFSGSQEQYYVYLVYDNSNTVTISVSCNEAVEDVADVLLPQATQKDS